MNLSDQADFLQTNLARGALPRANFIACPGHDPIVADNGYTTRYWLRLVVVIVLPF